MDVSSPQECSNLNNEILQAIGNFRRLKESIVEFSSGITSATTAIVQLARRGGMRGRKPPESLSIRSWCPFPFRDYSMGGAGVAARAPTTCFLSSEDGTHVDRTKEH